MDFWLVILVSLVGLCFLIFNTLTFFINRNNIPDISKLFVWYLVVLSLVEISCNLIGVIKPNANFFVSHFYFGFQFIFLSLLYYKLLQHRFIKILILIIGIIQMLYITSIYMGDIKLFWNFNTYEIVSTSTILMVYALYFIFSNFEIEHHYFNFSIGLILYLCCSITIFLSDNLDLVLLEKPFIDIWIFNSLFYILFQYFIFREFRFFKRNPILHK